MKIESGTTARSTREWIGASPDSVPPSHVKLRVLRRYQGKDYVTGALIRPADTWDTDHIKPLADGGENRERNLAPMLRQKHIEKTADENKARAKADRIALIHQGLKKRRPWNPYVRRKMDGTVVPK